MNKKEFMVQLHNDIATDLVAGILTHEEIAKKHGVSSVTVQTIGIRRNLRRKRGAGSPAWKSKLFVKQVAQ